MTGKQKCRILKEIRRQIAEQNDIRFVIEECTHKGKCRGTCPRCEWEVRMLERELEKRRASGRKIALAGISAGFLLTSCSPIDTVKEIAKGITNEIATLEGDMLAETTSGAVAATEQTEPEQTECVVTEGEPAWEMEEGEVEVTETTAGVPVADETEQLPELEEGEVLIVEETEEMTEIAGGIPLIEETDEVILEGDIRLPEPDAGETP
ncbi:MAG: hypothetical protein IJ497_11155 [Clostridia bacterium]|nr:hypothetical protein [Clostridia bacterium]